MRLTADVILRAHVCINPLRERELDLRGFKAPAVENLGVTKDGFDCIDLSDNEIKKLENFPRLRRLRMLLLNNNHISKIQETSLADAIGNLEYLILTGNRIAQLADIDRLAGLSKLDTLSLCGNPVAKRKFYREYVIHKLPQLRVLDFQKIKPHEREATRVLFQSVAGQRIEAEAQQETNGEHTVASSTQGMAQVAIAPPVAPVAPPPPPPPQQQKQQVPPSPAKKPVSPVKSPVKAKPEQKMEVDAAAPSTPPAKLSVDVEMEEEQQSHVVPFTPSKPIEQMTVNALREELKRQGLSIKGLKADLVKRLKEAVDGSA